MAPLRFGSVCSGIEAASVAWHPLGWSAAWLAEIEPFPSAVLAHHYPTTPNLGDMTTITPRVLAGEIEAPDVLVGGTPCQAFSVAGLRRSLDDERGNLALSFVHLADAVDSVRAARGEAPAWILWENVPGVLSTHDNAFGCLLAGLVGADGPIVPPGGKWKGAGVVAGPSRVAAWRILDAQHFGVAQRRRRVFVLARGGARAWSAADALLPVTESGARHPAPSRATRANSPAGPAGGAGVGGVPAGIPDVAWCLQERDAKGADSDTKPGHLIPVAFDTTQITHPKNRSSPQPGDPCHPIASKGHAPAVAFSISPHGGQGADLSACEIEVAPALDASQEAKKQDRGTRIVQAVPLLECGKRCGEKADPRDGVGIGRAGDPMFTLQAGAQHGVQQAMSVRRLTPRECERLQGFPDDWTLIPNAPGPKSKKLEEDYVRYLMRDVNGRRRTKEECFGLAADGPRYRALGNSMATVVMQYLGRAIQREEDRRE